MTALHHDAGNSSPIGATIKAIHSCGKPERFGKDGALSAFTPVSSSPCNTFEEPHEQSWLCSSQTIFSIFPINSLRAAGSILKVLSLVWMFLPNTHMEPWAKSQTTQKKS